ncbi:MAG TPA: hypothetical protein VLN45_11080 [Ignavibacteriaceae bacterium]|nr:hypothetical protein [Ignavibacteriaceae bacterium]
MEKLRTDLPNAHVVRVIEQFDASDYTYMKVEERDDEYWIAVPKMEVENDAVLYFTKSMEMKNFHSETLDRTFESILFVEDISQTPKSKDGKISHPNVESTKEDIKVEPLKDGYSIAKIFDEKESLSGKTIKVKGKVIKYNEGILDRNWIHIQDGTGEQGKHDLVVTTVGSVQIGQTIIAEGTVTLDKDFGSGYKYSVLLENAEIKPE